MCGKWYYLNIPMNVHHHYSCDEFDSCSYWCTHNINLVDLRHVDVYHLVLRFSPNRTDRRDITGILLKHSDISNMLESLIDNIFFIYLFILWTCLSTDSQHSSGYQLCSFHADFFLYSYEIGCISDFSRKTKGSVNCKLHYIDDVLPFDNSTLDY